MLIVWNSVEDNIVVSREELSDNTPYVIDFGNILETFILERCADDVRRIDVRDGVTTVCWRYFLSEADERMMIESVIHVVTGCSVRLGESTCRV